MKASVFQAEDLEICEIAEIDSSTHENTLCLCEHELSNIAYDCKGCLKCTNLDCAYYIQNMVETLMQIHHVEIYNQNK